MQNTSPEHTPRPTIWDRIQWVDVPDEEANTFSWDKWHAENVRPQGYRPNFPGSWDAPQEIPLTDEEVELVKAGAARDRQMQERMDTDPEYAQRITGMMQAAAEKVTQSALAAEQLSQETITCL